VKLEYIEPFLFSTLSVVQAAVRSSFTKGDIALRQGDELTGDVSVVIGIREQSGESIILNMDKATALHLCAALNGTVQGASTTLDMDAVGELANMIAGNAVSALNERGFDFTIHPPKTVALDDLPSLTQGLELLQVPLISEYGHITVNFTIRTN
jgi:chemotaxis protein CheX